MSTQMKTRSGAARRHAAARLLLVALLVAFAPRTGQAQTAFDLSLEELMRITVEPVFGASKRLQPVTEAPASVTIVTSAEIARYGYQTLADVLRSVRGFYVTNDRNYSFLGTRGFSRPGDFNTKILLLVDGHRMNDNVFDQAAIGRDFGLDVAMFERVEIVRGPSSSLYGTSAFLAVVNVIMRQGADIDGFTASGDVGALGARTARVAVGRKARGVDFLLSATYSGTEGVKRLYVPQFDTPATNDGIAEGLDDEAARQLFGRVTFADLTITAAYGRRVKGVPTASYFSAFNDPRLRTTDRRGFVDAEYARSIRNTQVALRTSFDRYYYDGAYPLEAEHGTALLRDYSIGMWTVSEARLTRRLPWRQTLTAGGEFRDHFRQAQGASYETSSDENFAIVGSSTFGAVYAQDEITLHPSIRATAGMRYDAYAEFSRFTPRLAVVLTPTRHQAFKYLYGSAFRAPNAFEYDYYTRGVRDSRLRPETITSHEIVWERYTGNSLRTSASLYRNRMAQVLALVEDPGGIFQLGWVNRGGVNSAGVELEAEWRFNRIEGLGSYTRQRTTDVETGAELTNSPRDAANLRFSTQGPRRGGSIAVDTHFLGRRRTIGGLTVAPAAVSSLTVIEPMTGRLDVVGAVRNLFGTRYAVPGSEEHRQDVIEQDGRTFSIGLRWRFPAK